ncbi:phenylacetate--CoA ligase family protein [Desulfitibacter alkalitolerans]|uniref:phenylacetate--CoA ligase family protein n=1 Tax=Desulfitibacter alkalitolerans TaxID=264641 RepID=UPI000685AC99|nr:phenylacetate--CoA ligase [Desulfitibacter alkalitolerans]
MALPAEIVEKRQGFTRQFPGRKAADLLNRMYSNSSFYRQNLINSGFRPERPELDISYEEFTQLPFTEKHELREGDPLAMLAVSEEDVVRIHSSSGTTGKPVVIPYTQGDVNDWAEMMKRCYEMAGVTKKDRVHITPGYGLWTAGIGFQAGVERLGAMAIPMGPGNTEKQLEMMVDLKSSVLIGTSSYGLLLAEEINRQGLTEQIHLKIGIFGSERWGEKMRLRIEQLLNIESFDIYGLTEIYGPGIGLDCRYHQGMHYWSDYLFMEIIDPVTGDSVPPGELGELVITTLTKEAMPLIRYRTRDLTRLILEPCPCGSPHPRLDRIMGRSDDMIKVKGINIYPGQIDTILKEVQGLSSEYQVYLSRKDGRDIMMLKVEKEKVTSACNLDKKLENLFKSKIGIQITAQVVEYGILPRSEKKTKRIYDER